MTSDSLSLHTGKQGCTAEELPELVHYLLKECSHLELCGLMTIGRMRHSIQQGPNPDFTVSAANLYQSCSESACLLLQTLVQCRESVMSAFNFPRLLELSMGMSADFEHAVSHGCMLYNHPDNCSISVIVMTVDRNGEHKCSCGYSVVWSSGRWQVTQALGRHIQPATAPLAPTSTLICPTLLVLVDKMCVSNSETAA